MAESIVEMLELHRPVVSELSDRVEDELRDMVMAYRVIELPIATDDKSVAAFQDGGTWIRGEQEMVAHLKVLRRRIERWNRFQSDACYIDDDGKTC